MTAAGGGAGLATGPLGPAFDPTFIVVAVNVVGILLGAGEKEREGGREGERQTESEVRETETETERDRKSRKRRNVNMLLRKE